MFRGTVRSHYLNPLGDKKRSGKFTLCYFEREKTWHYAFAYKLRAKNTPFTYN